MPNRDRTGPRGEGPMTGRGMGDCAEESNDRFSQSRGMGRGQGRGIGRGRGRQ